MRAMLGHDLCACTDAPERSDGSTARSAAPLEPVTEAAQGPPPAFIVWLQRQNPPASRTPFRQTLAKRGLIAGCDCNMRLFPDEYLSPRISQAHNSEGRHVATHPRDFGGLGAPEYDVLARCVELDHVLVTENAGDFRALVAAQDVHSGPIVLPCVGRTRSEALLRAEIDFLSEHGDPMEVMVNHVLEVSTKTEMTLYLLPTQE